MYSVVRAPEKEDKRAVEVNTQTITQGNFQETENKTNRHTERACGHLGKVTHKNQLPQSLRKLSAFQDKENASR